MLDFPSKINILTKHVELVNILSRFVENQKENQHIFIFMTNKQEKATVLSGSFVRGIFSLIFGNYLFFPLQSKSPIVGLCIRMLILSSTTER